MALRSSVVAAAFALSLGCGLAGMALAQTPDQTPAATPDPAEAVTTVDEIIIVARLSGAPIWEISDGAATLILVGDLVAPPEETPWDPVQLQAAVRRVDKVLLGTRVRGSFSDILRLIWRSRTLIRLPGETTTADYLSAETQARLDVLEAQYRQDYDRISLMLIASDLLTDQLRFERDTGTSAGDVVRRTARRARIPVRAVIAGRGDDLIDNLLTTPPETHRPCLEAAIAATEAGREGVIQRGRDWTRLRVPEVRQSALEQALEQCWPWGDPRTGADFRAAWLAEIETALTGDAVVMGVGPLGLLAEPDGLLDRLEARGYVIDGPMWRE
jgi:hypothetical protein